MSTGGDVRCVHCHADAPEAQPTCPGCGEDPRLEGRYLLLDVIGQGATGTLYRAKDNRSGRMVAVKERHPSGEPGADTLFEREVRVLRELDHPRVPAYVDAFTSGRGRAARRYLVQELVEGRSLAEELTTRRYTADEVWAIVREVAGILAYLHRLSPPVIHRDIKPGNVMRRRDGTLVLVDFGAVRDRAPGTLGGQTVAGTFGFMAPEQFMGEAEPKSDLYALGALAVALLSREDPATLHDRLRNFRWEGAVDVPAPLRELLRTMLAEDPAARPEAAELARAEAPPARSPAEDDPNAIEVLAARGRRKLDDKRREAQLEAQREAAARDEASNKRLREGLVGPTAGWILRHQNALGFLATMFSLTLGVGATIRLMDQVPAIAERAWLALPLMLLSTGLSVLGALMLVDGALAAIARSSNAREQAWLTSLPFPVDQRAYRDGLAAFHHSALVRLELTIGATPDASRVDALREALVGAGLGGSVAIERKMLVLTSPKLDVTSWHGKRLETVISHHSLLHAWVRGVIERLVLPTREKLGVQAARLEVVDD
jgi:hypothetical protein